MTHSLMIKLPLGLAGLIAAAVGFGILFVPHAFYAASGIAIGTDASLLNELRAPGGMVLAIGLFALMGTARNPLTLPALALSVLLYLGFGLSRLVSIVLDGMPNTTMVQTTVLELAVGGLCAAALAVTMHRQTRMA